LKKARVQEIFSLLQLNCSRARHKYSIQELKKTRLELHLLEKSEGEESFGLAGCLGRAARTGGGELTGGGSMGIGDGVTVGAKAGLVMS